MVVPTLTTYNTLIINHYQAVKGHGAKTFRLMEERKHWYTGMTVDELNKLDSAFIGAADRAEAALEAVGADTSELAASLAMSAALQLTATDSIAAAAAAASSPSSQREGEREEERENNNNEQASPAADAAPSVGACTDEVLRTAALLRRMGVPITLPDDASENSEVSENSECQEEEPFLTEEMAQGEGRTGFRLLATKSANEWMRQAASRPDPVPLYRSLWYENEVSCLFSDTNSGKSVLAVQIAAEVAQSRRVLYCDFELSDKQFQSRYTDEQGNLHTFPDNFLRAEIDIDAASRSGGVFSVIAEIERAADAADAKVVIIDNISFLCNSLEKGEDAGLLVMRLIDMKRRRGLSMLLIAHTPKRMLTSPLTQNDLAGSKRIINFMDSAFAIGRSATDEHLRYIKQVKVRNGAVEYGADSVLLCEMDTEGGWLHFRDLGTVEERTQLREQTDKEDDRVNDTIRRMLDEGCSYREMAGVLGISSTAVFKRAKKLRLQSC